jgi:outer membrane protein OmpA-like peptidoglycan-associated protein
MTVLIAAVGQLYLLDGCRTEVRPAIAVVAGQHANAVVPDQVRELDDALTSTRTKVGTRLIVVRADGDPQTVLDLQRDKEDTSDNPEDTDILAEELKGVLLDGKAAVPEVDLLGAIDRAARGLHESPGPKTLFVIDPGLQTAGTLRFQSGLLLAEPADVVAHLKQSNSLPDLRGISVVLIGIGAVADPQPDLPIPARRRLEAIWPAILVASGADGPVKVIQNPPRPRSKTGPLPKVTVVPVRQPPTPLPCQLQADSLGFEPDEAILREPKVAVEQLRRCVASLATARRVEVIGTTSSAGTEEGRMRLSRQRADVVRNLLIGLGVPAGRVTARGIGNHCHPPCVNDRPNKVLDPVLAARNRLVIVKAS